MKSNKLILFGDKAFAEVAYEYFTHDSDYEVVAFAVNKDYMQSDNKFGLPVVPFEEVQNLFSPKSHSMYISLVYNDMNKIRAKFYNEAKAKGYKLANYVSSKAFVWRNVTYGDNVFIFEDNTVQPFVKLGSNLVLWSGNHIGHHSTIGDHCFIASHVVISGFCSVGDYCFMGVNAAVGNHLSIGDNCLIGAGALVVKNVPAKTLVKGTPSPWTDISGDEKKFNLR